MGSESYLVTIVSCDIVGHSSAAERDQVARIAAINLIVADTIELCAAGDVIWASGGDGGHVVFRQDSWQLPAVNLALALREWSVVENVPLRITAHRGCVSDIRGADGRVQVIGSGINHAGWLLTQVHQEALAVSAPFHDGVENVELPQGVEFHDPRSVLKKDPDLQIVYLMSSKSHRSSWGSLAVGDRAALANAVRTRASWDVLYYAKRVWQVSSADRDVVLALESVEPQELRFWDTRVNKEELNPFVGQPQPDELAEMLRLGKLVERRRGEFICQYDDPGDSLFVILRGEVGVFNSEDVGLGPTGAAKHTHRQGDIVGELAYALSRNRTAALVALTDVALLSFRYEDIRLLSKANVGSIAARNVSLFINYRVLQHVCDNATYLLGPDRKGALSVGVKRWETSLIVLRKYSELITVRKRPIELTLDHVASLAPRPKGIYILAAGTLELEGSVLEGNEFPVLWVDLPHLLPVRAEKYSVRDYPVKILWIGARGVDELAPPQLEALRRELDNAINRRSTGADALGEQVLNSVGGTAGIVLQAGRIDGDVHIHPGGQDIQDRPADDTCS